MSETASPQGSLDAIWTPKGFHCGAGHVFLNVHTASQACLSGPPHLRTTQHGLKAGLCEEGQWVWVSSVVLSPSPLSLPRLSS